MISAEENYKYKQFVEQLYLKSQEIQTENERYAYR